MKNAMYVELKVVPRYWEDGFLNGQDDTEGNMPLRDGDSWCPMIRLEDGQIMGWEVGLPARIHYKVCDEGEYWIQDANGWRIAKYYTEYVPKFLAVDTNGFGDYIIFNVDSNGKIVNWKKPELVEKEWIMI